MFRRTRSDLKAAWLEQHSRLYGLTRAEIDTLAASADRVTVPAGTVLVRDGQLGREAFLIVRGAVEIRRDGRIVATVGGGDLVGEQALVARAHRNADAVTTVETELAVFDVRSFERALAGSPALRAHVEQTVAARAAA
ncbi:cyclic nucleotide-binding domain-containing protein [Nitriliruptor alkaliphilus]|uniref:cyclic nucleotide-binding domain-containing protein n=1 Tax=Nitriliruptor alkaliphilus TaxID=427918 RepID=UPI000698228A|nr:cyclic nucleotide-binding domain-containing protein [Nitriliruptor alkaliphilus]